VSRAPRQPVAAPATVRTTPPAARQRRPAPDETRWAAVVRRDREADHAFCYGVLTTGVYSRPSCPARTPERGNAVFFTDAHQARRAGFRPCLRCRPDDEPAGFAGEHAALHACRAMERPGQTVSLDSLAALSGFSRFHFHRLFTRTIGVTPGTYATVCRAEHLRHVLSRAHSITEAIYQSGFNSTGTFYTLTRCFLGMTPTAHRDGGRGVSLRYAVVTHQNRSLLVAATAAGICRVLSGEDEDTLVCRLRSRYPEASHITPDAALTARLAHAAARTAPDAGTRLPADIRNRALEGRLRKTLSRTP
jgi:AraC family transcriptional regulator, regulatory protein of adaptative response / methylated-DNA-[protein]-cysteine methyltransferase